MKESLSEAVAIIGMTGRFPGAANVEEFWRNLINGVESISRFSDEELSASGLDARALRKDPSYVPARGVLKNAEYFDAGFFGMNAKQAEVTDPQQRVFIEASWEALENAGYDPGRVSGPIGVFAGSGDNTYYLNNVHPRPDLFDLVGERVITLGNEKDYLATWVAYKLNLKGPAISINTACSTSLVATCQACQSLLNYQCDMALAGGVWISFPQRRFVRFQEGGILSPDGHCRTFDEQAQGTVSSEGVGIVVLKRLEDALNDRDHIHGVIRGFGLNNDGANKVGFTAPSVDGQADAIATALAAAGLEPGSISYVECHGTATRIGDPIEIAGLTQAFRMGTSAKNFCAIGSVKSNIGHLGAAAGAAGLIKTVLALRYKMLPPSLHFKRPNPKIDFADSPFFVNSTLREWKDVPMPRRAGVSSFGLGGTNAHVVVEESAEAAVPSPSRPWQLLVVSAKTAPALEAATDHLAAHLKANPGLNLADAAFTLKVGRRAFEHRRILVCRNAEEAVEALQARDAKRVATDSQDAGNPAVAFMFPGQGAQHVNMGVDLYSIEPVFKEAVDRCAEALLPYLGTDLREAMYPRLEKAKSAEELLTQTRIAQPALFTIEYALATLWMSWGIRPAALIGHSIGEYVAACLAGVFTLEDALGLVAKRGQLMQSMQPGAMLAVPMPESEVRTILPASLSLASVNGPFQCVVSGAIADVEAFRTLLEKSGKSGTRLKTSHAFHSAMMDPILQPFAAAVNGVKRNRPEIPIVSNLTGTWMTAEEAVDPQYWAKHLRQTVRFGEGIRELLMKSDTILLEVGPGTTLNSLARLQMEQSKGKAIVSSLRHAREERSDISCLLAGLGQLWLRGVEVDWSGFHAHESRCRVPLPTYPFQRERYWVEAKPAEPVKTVTQASPGKNPDIADWFYVPSWKRLAPPPLLQKPVQRSRWLVFLDECGLGSSVGAKLEEHSESVTRVRMGKNFESGSGGSFVIDPSNPDHYGELLKRLQRQGRFPQRIAHFWSVTANLPTIQPEWESFQGYRRAGFDSVLFLTQALCEHGIRDTISIDLVSNGIQEVIGGERLYPGKVLVMGLRKAISQECPNLPCRSIDVVLENSAAGGHEDLAEQVAAELISNDLRPVVAYRGSHRWCQEFEHLQLDGLHGAKSHLRDRGVYLITGGLGKIGLCLSEFLAENYRARLILMGRSGLPPKEEWPDWLDKHGGKDITSLRIKAIQKLEGLGAEVLLLTADVGNRDEVRDSVSVACDKFGRINGAFHCAGITSSAAFEFIHNIKKDHCEMHFRPKIYGVLSLADVLKDQQLDFVCLASSRATVAGGFGLAVYSAANQYMDAFALSRGRAGGPLWISVNWDRWGDDVATGPAEANGASSEFNLTPSEGVEAFRRILCKTRVSQIIVSTGDLDSRQDVRGRPQLPENVARPGVGKVTQSHARPDLRTAYVPVQNENEKKVAVIWENLLGIEKVGTQDNFFDLGGDSLLLMQVQVKIKHAFGVDLSSAEMFEHPTVNMLAQRIGQPAAAPAGLELVQQRALLQKAAMNFQGRTGRQNPAKN